MSTRFSSLPHNNNKRCYTPTTCTLTTCGYLPRSMCESMQYLRNLYGASKDANDKLMFAITIT